MNQPKATFGKGVWYPAAIAGLLGAAFFAAEKPAKAANPGQEQVSKDFQKTVTLGSGQSVRIEHQFGQVRVHGEAGHEVKISATIRAQTGSRSESEAFADKIRIEVEQAGDGVHIRTVYPEKRSFSFRDESGHGTFQVSYSVNYDISMPGDAPLNIKNSFGSVDAAGIHGSADIENSHGSLAVRDAGAAHLSNSFGSIELNGAGGNITINDNNGAVQATDVKGALEVRNRFGNITTKNIQGAVTITGGNGTVTLADTASASITNSFGNVDARNVRGDLSVHDNNGNVDVATIGGAADITNSFGNVTFSDIHGRVN